MPMTEVQTPGLDLSDNTLGSILTALGAVWLLLWVTMALAGGVITLATAPQQATAAYWLKLALFTVPTLVGCIACFRQFSRYAHQAAPSKTADEDDDWGVLVDAKILKRREKTLQNPRFLGGSESNAQATVAVGAYLILTGQWSMTIEYEVDGHRVVDHGKVSSQVYYRYAKADTMPIRINPLTPTEWRPVLDRPSVPAAQLAASPVTISA
ncbi:MAG: hypothetical protein AAGE94_12635 [Acidobacteriota bacterium]